MAAIEYTWRPVSGPEVKVELRRDMTAPRPHLDVLLGPKELGSVFRDENPAYGWRWRLWGSRQVRGGGLGSYQEAVSALLYELRRAERV